MDYAYHNLIVLKMLMQAFKLYPHFTYGAIDHGLKVMGIVITIIKLLPRYIWQPWERSARKFSSTPNVIQILSNGYIVFGMLQ